MDNSGYFMFIVSVGGNKMNEDEKTEMLFEVTRLVTHKLANTLEEIRSYLKTYPELSGILTLILDVSIFDTKVLQVVSGRRNVVEQGLKDLQEQAK
jgi:hypothetical protein